MKLKPCRLRPGDKVGLVSPSSPVHPSGHTTPEQLELGCERLRELGWEPVLGQNALKVRGYLAGRDEERGADINRMFADPEIAGIMCTQGGYGTPRLLPHLDYDIIRRNPKVFVGYSDITALHVAISRRTGLVTFHGPMVGYDMSKEFVYTREWLLRAVARAEPIGPITNPADGPAVEAISGGVAVGELVGGNLSLLVATLGTPYEVDTRGKILFLEDIGEAPYRFDRMLTHLALAGKLAQAAGIIIGECVDCVPAPSGPPSLVLEEIIGDLVRPLGKPALKNLVCGHGRYKVTLPLGCRARIDGDRGMLAVEEAGVTD